MLKLSLFFLLLIKNFIDLPYLPILMILNNKNHILFTYILVKLFSTYLSGKNLIILTVNNI